MLALALTWFVIHFISSDQLLIIMVTFVTLVDPIVPE